ncbi:hypothetical protein EV196_10693 [Mariniflexile fucanivorans]|uniref:Secreted protein n=1 Tax=Mariniflexile fucanivorans TaxID=264023 RepID=A0A4R1RFZ7_9FLAO|nr:hypothetical protein [Mariniflexile fucanivorans]TCL64904.1 hypothetical protein EV196_10693 [Mariniflexile fucanivorans]
MKFFLSFLILISATFFANAQIDSQNKSTAIPAVESKKEVDNTPKITPSQPNNNTNNSTFGSLNVPNLSTGVEAPKKEFSLFGEKFGNPGELYTKQLDDQLANTKLTPEEVEARNGSLTDQYFGDFKSNAKSVNVSYRDHGYVDGDLIQVLVNDDVVQARVFLNGGFRGFKLDLQKGFNKIDFLALNQGESGPNTAEFRVVDDKGILVSANRWNLATGVKATIIIVKD